MRTRAVFVMGMMGALGLVAHGAFTPEVPSSPAEQKVAALERQQAQDYCQMYERVRAKPGKDGRDPHSEARKNACYYVKLERSPHAEIVNWLLGFGRRFLEILKVQRRTIIKN